MSKHTPGPWEVDDSDYRTADGGLCVMAGNLCVSVIGSDSDKPQAENARLIAAAPELFAVAKDFKETLGELGLFCECGETDCRTTRLRAAIAKATGEQP